MMESITFKIVNQRVFPQKLSIISSYMKYNYRPLISKRPVTHPLANISELSKLLETQIIDKISIYWETELNILLTDNAGQRNL